MKAPPHFHAIVASLSPGPDWHHIRLSKTADKGTLPDHPIFEGYTVWGHCEELPQVGARFQVLRYQRNDVELPGIMTTSEVKEVNDIYTSPVVPEPWRYITFETANSVYRLDFLPDAS